MTDQDLINERMRQSIIDTDREYGFSKEHTRQRLRDFDLRVAGHQHVAGKLVASDTNKAVAFYECVERKCSAYLRPIPEATYDLITPKLN